MIKVLDPVPLEVVNEVQRLSRLDPNNILNSKIEAAAYAAKMLKVKFGDKKSDRIGQRNCEKYLWGYVRRLLNANQFKEAAIFLWGEELFNVKPRSVRIIWEWIPKTAQLLIMGHGAAGKSFTVMVYLMLEYAKDPEYTTIKLISSTGSSADATLKSQLANFYRLSYIKFPGSLTATYLGKDSKERKFGIERLAIPQGEDAKARLRGKCHPFPRPKAHEFFGTHSRSFVYVDEAEAVSEGVWEELQNVLNARDETGRIKVIVSSNPKDSSSRYGMHASHPSGWDYVINEQLDHWKSETGWDVIWLDGAKCENVVQKKVVYQGLLTYEGYNQYLPFGDPGPEFWTMARGMFPQTGQTSIIIPSALVESSFGFVNFVGKVIYCAALDVALQGGDRPLLTIGRFGPASGWRKMSGEVVQFEKMRYQLQVDSQFQLPNGDTNHVVNESLKVLDDLSIQSEWIAMDSTGNGAGVYDVMKLKRNPSILPINWGEGCTETKIMAEDTRNCDQLYHRLPTEMWFAAKKYFEFDYIKVHPLLRSTSFFHELTTRRYFQSEHKKLQAESKDLYKGRNSGRSPDRADSFIMLIHLLRHRHAFDTEMVQGLLEEADNAFEPRLGIVDKMAYVNFN